MKKLQYKVEKVEDGIRYLTVYCEGKIMTELECLGDYMTNGEEIEFWLDDNGYGDEEYEIEEIF